MKKRRKKKPRLSETKPTNDEHVAVTSRVMPTVTSPRTTDNTVDIVTRETPVEHPVTIPDPNAETEKEKKKQKKKKKTKKKKKNKKTKKTKKKKTKKNKHTNQRLGLGLGLGLGYGSRLLIVARDVARFVKPNHATQTTALFCRLLCTKDHYLFNRLPLGP